MSWNAQADLRRCLESLAGATADAGSLETVVVDNASDDGSADMVAREFPWAKLVRLPTNTGFSGGNNVALENLDAPYALLLNSDATCAPGSLDTLLDWADGQAGAGIVGPKVVNPDGSLQFSCRRFPTFAAGVFRNVYVGRLFPWQPPRRRLSDAGFRPRAHARCGLGFRLRPAYPPRLSWSKSAGLDAATFFMYCEDMDWCLRAHDARWRVVYYPDAVVTHAIGRSSDRAADRMIWEHSRSMWRFYRKHRQFFRGRVPLGLRPFVLPGIFLRAIVRIARRRFVNPVLALLRGGKVADKRA